MAISSYYLIPPLPKGLEGLAELGLDLRWSWSHTTDFIWETIAPDLWKLTRNPWFILQSVSYSRLEELGKDQDFRKQLAEQLKGHHDKMGCRCWYSDTYTSSKMKIAYFSMEFGLSEALPIYSGGLGILAGDHLKTASDLDIPIVGIGLLYQQGYFRQVINSLGAQVEYFPYSNPTELPVMPVRDKDGEWLIIELNFPGRTVKFRVWEAKVGRIRLYLLDSNDPTNLPPDRGITAELYGGGQEMRLEQEIVLGIGGWKLLKALDINVNVCHLNEGHAALVTIERAKSFMEDHGQPFNVSLAVTRAGNIFTTHTPVEAGFDRFPPALVGQYLNAYVNKLGINFDSFLALGRQNAFDSNELFNMAYLAIRGARMVNAVSQLHGRVSRRIFQPLFPRWPQHEVPVTSVTNGVHMPSWDSAEADELWSKACGQKRWLGTMNTIDKDFKKVPDEKLWEFRNIGRLRLIQYVRERLARQLTAAGTSNEEIRTAEGILDTDALTIGFARRFATYKRPNLLLRNPDRLLKILKNTDSPVQLLIAGKAHPKDEIGKKLIQEWFDFLRRFDLHSHVVFLADYDMSLAEHFVQGVDLWLNTPRRLYEASGTSGMKVLVNGGLNLSELDGWWAEAYRPQVGWAIGDSQEHDSNPNWDAIEAEQLYNVIEKEVIPAFYNRGPDGIPGEWVSRMRLSMTELTPRFSSNRMMREYVEKLYLPAEAAYHMRSANKCEVGIKLFNWQRTLRCKWSNLRFGELKVQEKEGYYTFEVPVYLADLEPASVEVQLYAQPIDGDNKSQIYVMNRGKQITNPIKGYLYKVRIAAKRPANDYTPRIIPAFDGALVPIDSNQILWYR